MLTIDEAYARFDEVMGVPCTENAGPQVRLYDVRTPKGRGARSLSFIANFVWVEVKEACATQQTALLLELLLDAAPSKPLWDTTVLASVRFISATAVTARLVCTRRSSRYEMALGMTAIDDRGLLVLLNEAAETNVCRILDLSVSGGDVLDYRGTLPCR